MKRPDEGASNVETFRPGDAGMAGLEAGQTQPDVGASREIEMGGGPETLGRKFHDLHRNTRGAALAQAGGQVDRGALDVAALSRRPGKGRGGRKLAGERQGSTWEGFGPASGEGRHGGTFSRHDPGPSARR